MLAAPQAFEMPYVEKYRPVTLEDVVGNNQAIDQLKSIVKFGNMPNLILVVSSQPRFTRNAGPAWYRKNLVSDVHGAPNVGRDGQVCHTGA